MEYVYMNELLLTNWLESEGLDKNAAKGCRFTSGMVEFTNTPFYNSLHDYTV